MRHQGRHRQVALGQKRLRRTATVATVTASALIAPLAFSGSVTSQAAVIAPTIDSLANHPEWLLSAADPEVASQITDLKQVLSDHGQTYSTISAYRLPTVDGFVTYVTTSPATMTVSRNPGLISHSPDGDTVVDLKTVLARLLEAEGTGAGGIDIPSIELMGEPFADIVELIDDTEVPSVRYLVGAIENLIESAVGDPNVLLGQLQATVNATIVSAQTLATELLEDALVILGNLPTTDELVQNVLDAVDPTLTTVESLRQAVADTVAALDVLGQVNDVLAKVPTDPNALIAQVQAVIDQLTEPLPPIDPLALLIELRSIAAEQADALLTAAGLPTLDELEPTMLVWDVVPIAAATAPVNTETDPTDPIAQPVAEPVDAGAALTPETQMIYPQPASDGAKWNRNNDDCFTASSNAWYRRICWNLDNQIYDDSSSYTYWQFNLDGQSYPKQGRGMFTTWVEGKPHTGEGVATQYFDGTHPRPTAEFGGEEGCTDRTQGVQVSGGKPVQLGKSYSFAVRTCERYAPKGYDDQGHYSNKWHYNPDHDPNGVGYHRGEAYMRHVALTMGIKTTSTSKSPSWGLLTGTYVTKQCWYC